MTIFTFSIVHFLNAQLKLDFEISAFAKDFVKLATGNKFDITSEELLHSMNVTGIYVAYGFFKFIIDNWDTEGPKAEFNDQHMINIINEAQKNGLDADGMDFIVKQDFIDLYGTSQRDEIKDKLSRPFRDKTYKRIRSSVNKIVKVFVDETIASEASKPTSDQLSPYRQSTDEERLTFYSSLFKSKASIGFVKDLLYASEIERNKLRETLPEEEEKANKLFVKYMDKILDNKPQKESAYNTRAAASPAEKKSYKDQLANNTKPKANNNNNQKKIVENKNTAITTSTTAPTSTATTITTNTTNNEGNNNITIDDKFVALELKNDYVKQKKLVEYCYVRSPSPSTSPGKTAIKDSSNQQQQQLQLKQLLSTILSSELLDPVLKTVLPFVSSTSSTKMDVEEEYKKSWWEGIEENKKMPFDEFVETLTKDLIRGNEIGQFEHRWILKVTEGTLKSAVMKEIVDKVISYKKHVKVTGDLEGRLAMDIERLLTAHGRFLLLLKLSKNRLQVLSHKTPGTGFCYYLMHYQAYKFSSEFLNVEEGTTTFPEVKADVVLGEEFKKLVKEDIDYFQKEIAASSQETDFDKPDCEIAQYKVIVQKLKAVLHFIETEKKTILPNEPFPEEFVEYKDIELSNHERSLWGNNVGMGVPFVRPRNLPFSFFMKYRSSNGKYPLASFSTHSFDIGNSKMMGDVKDHCLPFQLITEMATLCGPQNYAGYCNMAGHFHFIDKPILTVEMLRMRVKGISYYLLEVLLHVELGNSASEFMEKLLEKFGTEQTIVRIDQDEEELGEGVGTRRKSRSGEEHIVDNSSAEVIPLQEFINRLSQSANQSSNKEFTQEQLEECLKILNNQK